MELSNIYAYTSFRKQRHPSAWNVKCVQKHRATIVSAQLTLECWRFINEGVTQKEIEQRVYDFCSHHRYQLLHDALSLCGYEATFKDYERADYSIYMTFFLNKIDWPMGTLHLNVRIPD